MLYDVHEKMLDDLRDTYGHRPDEKKEKWAIFKDMLIVINHEHKPRLYRVGCAGVYEELEPNLSGDGVVFVDQQSRGVSDVR